MECTNNTAILESLLSQGGADESPGYKQYSYIREPTEPRWELMDLLVTNNTSILKSLLSQGGADGVYKQYSYIREPTEPRWS